MKRNYYFVATSLALLSLSFLTFQLFQVLKNPPQSSFELGSKNQPAAEFDPTGEVLLSELILTDYGAVDLIRAIISADANVNLLTERELNRKHQIVWLKEIGLGEEAVKRVHFTPLATDSPWIRDYGPIVAKTSQQKSVRFFDFKPEQATKRDAELAKKFAILRNVPTTTVTTTLSGGNLLTNGSLCFLSGQDFQSADALRYELGCKRTIYYSNAPHPHIDMWAKILNEQTVAISEITQTTLDFARRKNGHVPFELQKLRDDLNTLAKEFSKELTVVRLPMPMPYRNTFRNYTNALIVNKTAIVPSYDTLGWNYDQYPDAELKGFYEETTKRRFEEHGFTVVFVKADKLIFGGGALHCAALQLPGGLKRITTAKRD